MLALRAAPHGRLGVVARGALDELRQRSGIVRAAVRRSEFGAGGQPRVPLRGAMCGCGRRRCAKKKPPGRAMVRAEFETCRVAERVGCASVCGLYELKHY